MLLSAFANRLHSTTRLRPSVASYVLWALLLGTFGLAAIQLRSVIERRGELALLRATGFTRRSLGRMVLIENVALLSAGLATGVLAALVAVIPHRLTGTAAVPPTPPPLSSRTKPGPPGFPTKNAVPKVVATPAEPLDQPPPDPEPAAPPRESCA